MSGQIIAGHATHEGGCHAHVPSVPRVHAADLTGPEQAGSAYGGAGPHTAAVQGGGGLQLHVGQPLASRTLPYWQKMAQTGPHTKPVPPVPPEAPAPPPPAVPAPAAPPSPEAPAPPAAPLVPAPPFVPPLPAEPAAPVCPLAPVAPPPSAPPSGANTLKPQPVARTAASDASVRPRPIAARAITASPRACTRNPDSRARSAPGPPLGSRYRSARWPDTR